MHPFAFLPHSIRWQVALVRADAGRPRRSPRLGSTTGRPRCCSAAGSSGWPSTVAKNVAYAVALRRRTRCRAARSWYRATVAYLHFIQPLARVRGRIRGVLVAARSRAAAGRRRRPAAGRGRRSREAWRALLLLSGTRHRGPLLERDVDVGRSRAVAADRLAAPLARRARDRNRRRLVRRSRRQRSGRPLGVARRARAGRGSRRRQVAAPRQHAPAADDVRRRQRRSALGLRAARRRAAPASRSAGRRPARSPAALHDRSIIGALRVCGARRRRRPSCGAGIGSVTLGAGHDGACRRGRRGRRSSRRRCCASTACAARTIFVVMILALGASTFMLREAATGPGHRRRRRGTPATTGRPSRPGSTRRAASSSPPNGDVYIADSNNHVIRRIDAGNTQHRAGRRQPRRSAPASPATTAPRPRAQLDTPDGVAIAPDGDLIVADSHNDRIRRVDRPTGIITTIAGSGENGYDGDDKPAIEAALEHAERGRRRAQRRHLHRRHAELPHPHDRRTRPGSSTPWPATARPATAATSATAARPPART